MKRRTLLIPIQCKQCKKEFVYCFKSRRDRRCYDCKKGTSVEEVEKELREMSKEEFQAFMDEIEEYEKSK